MDSWICFITDSVGYCHTIRVSGVTNADDAMDRAVICLYLNPNTVAWGYSSAIPAT
jgi:hypothetical protein